MELLYVNCRAPLMLAHEFGRQMIARRKGGVIFVSSMSAFFAAPYWLGYSSSKAYNLFNGLALWGELRKYNVDVQALCPGSTKTEFGSVTGVRSRFGSMPPGPVIEESLRKLGKKPMVVTGFQNRMRRMGLHFVPRTITTLIAGRILRSLRVKTE